MIKILDDGLLWLDKKEFNFNMFKLREYPYSKNPETVTNNSEFVLHDGIAVTHTI